MSWKVIGHKTIYREKGWYAVHPNVICTPKGDLLVLFHRSPAHGYSRHGHPLFDIRGCRSTDQGQTWGSQKLISTYPLGGVADFGTQVLFDGSIFLHASSVELVPDRDVPGGRWLGKWGKPFWIKSFDDGFSWSQPEKFPAIPDSMTEDPASHNGVCRSGLIELPDGKLLLPGKATDDPKGQPPYFGTLRISHDMGQTWEFGGRIAEDIHDSNCGFEGAFQLENGKFRVGHFSEPAACRTKNGKIILLWRYYPKGFNDEKLTLEMTYSEDDGNTWSEHESTTVRAEPGHILRLRDGRMFITAGTRWQGQCGCTGRVVEPEGGDLNTAEDFIIRNDSSDSDCGYPWSVELEDGSVLVVYYYVHKDGTRSIEGSILKEQ
jgi:hypothetical protein